MPIEIYIAILVASLCSVVLTASFLGMAVYFKTRLSLMENQVARLEGDVAGLLQESREFVREMQELAARSTGTMQDIERITHTAREWTQGVDRVMGVVALLTGPAVQRVSRKYRYGSGFLSGVLQALRAPEKKC